MPAALLNNGLAASLASGGRLSGLLAAGTSTPAARSLTWAIDPALLADAATMTKPYRVGSTPTCAARGPDTASPAAAAWLAGLRSATAGQPVFVTPYADADVAALTGPA